MKTTGAANTNQRNNPMTDTPPHIALAIERVKEIANGANKITEVELQSLCDLAIKALTPPPPGQYDELVKWIEGFCDETNRRIDNAFMPYITLPAQHVAAKANEAASAITDLQQQVRDARGKALEESAEIIRKYAVTESANGPSLRERYYGDIHAMHYATAILALKDKRPVEATENPVPVASLVLPERK